MALRPTPTLKHYDPEAVDYWVTVDGRGSRRTLIHDTPMPRSEDFSWGMIRLVDRLGVSNEYLTFGGHLDAALIDDVVVAAFVSQAPLLRRGGHSQGWDEGADAIGGFFARMMVAVDYKPGFERSFAEAEPLTRYAAFVRDSDDRRHGQGTTSTTTPWAASSAMRQHDCGPRPQARGMPLAPCSTPPFSTDVRPGGRVRAEGGMSSALVTPATVRERIPSRRWM